MQFQIHCSFPPITGGKEVNIEKSFTSCQNACLENHECIAFSYNEDDGKCVMSHKMGEFDLNDGQTEFDQLFHLSKTTRVISSSAYCTVISTRDWNTLSMLGIFFQEKCDFKGFDIVEPEEMKRDLNWILDIIINAKNNCRDHNNYVLFGESSFSITTYLFRRLL